MATFGYGLRLEGVKAQCCNSTARDWQAEEAGTRRGAAGGAGSAPAEVAPRGVAWRGAVPRYASHADDGEGVGLHAGRVALVISSNFLSGFNGMQQRAAQLAAALGKQGFALHFIALGNLSSTEECAAAAPAMVCHAPGDYAAQYAGFLAWARRRRAVPSLLLLGFTSLTLELSRALLRLPASAFGRWRRGGYDPSHAPKAHRCLVMRDWARRDFPQAPPRPPHPPPTP